MFRNFVARRRLGLNKRSEERPEKYIIPRRLGKDVLTMWSVFVRGRKVNGQSRLCGEESSYSSCRCDYPGCIGSVQEHALVDDKSVLICRGHFTPESAVRAFEWQEERRRKREAKGLF